MEPIASTPVITLLDVLQATPHLLRCIEATPGVDGQHRSSLKEFRLVCRQARASGLKAVTCCDLKLSPGAIPRLISFAKLLSSSPLHRLKLDVHVTASPADPDPAGPPAEIVVAPTLPSTFWERLKRACCFSSQASKLAPTITLLSSPGENIFCQDESLASPTSQLRSFIAAIGAGLAGVTSINLSRQLKSPDTTAASNRMSKQAGLEIAAMLARACPRLSHIGVNCEVGAAMLGVFGSECPRLTSLHLTGNGMLASEIGMLMRLKQLPHITHITMDLSLSECYKWPVKEEVSCRALMRAICECTTLTHLWVGRQHLQGPEEWMALPHTLRELRCFRLPSEALPRPLLMEALERVEMSAPHYWIGCLQLLGMLRAAPNLQSLARLHDPKHPMPTDGCSLKLSPCTRNSVGGLQLLQQRMLAGLQLDRVHIACRVVYEESPQTLVPLGELLSMLDPFPGFTHCVLQDVGQLHQNTERWTEWSSAVMQHASANLQELERLMPNMVLLECSGDWNESAVEQLMAGRSLQVINWLGLMNVVTNASLVQLLVRMPWVRSLSHDARSGHVSTKELQQLLLAAQNTHAGGGAVGSGGVSVDPNIVKRVDVWTVSRGRRGACRQEVWARCATAREERSCRALDD